jgi:metallophosphoesterase superfamily enzyme
MKNDVSIFVVSDSGREGCYDQQIIARLMGEIAGRIKPKCIISTGDVHHGNGVKSVKDNDWQQNFEDVYTHPKLNMEWHSALGNHEYRGNTQAIFDYSKVNPRWNTPERYYTKVVEAKGTSVRFVIIDTTPLIERYRSSSKYPDCGIQDKEAQLEWLKNVLREAKEDWVIVAGHHPIHADTKKSKSERSDMRNSVDNILRKYKNVDMYVCGHIHNFQHLRDKKSHIDYIVNSSGAESRDVKSTKRTIFCSGETGFSVISANEKELSLYMVDKNGNILNTVKRKK